MNFGNSQTYGRDYIRSEGIVRTITRPGPTYYRPALPVIGLRNFGRSLRFQEDGRYSQDGLLQCRWESELGQEIDELFRAIVSCWMPIRCGGPLRRQTRRYPRISPIQSCVDAPFDASVLR